jgi:hypothetical protein
MLNNQNKINMETVAKNIELTEAELQMIQLKREREELEKKEKDNARQIKEGQEIQKQRTQIEYDTKRDAQLISALEKLFNELPVGEYELIDKNKIQEYSCYHYDSSKEDKEYYFKELVERKSKEIVHKESKSTITVHFHSVLTGSGFFRRSIETGDFRFELGIPGKYDGKNSNLASAKTIDKKIKEYVAMKKQKEETAKAKLEGIEWLKEQVTQMYPEARVTEEQRSGYYADSYRRRDYREGSKFIKVVFASGLEIEYSWRTNEKDELIVHRDNVNFNKLPEGKMTEIINSLI